MAESTLTVTWTTLIQFLATRLSWGTSAAPASEPVTWSQDQLDELQRIIDEGERQRLSTPQVGPFSAGHPWSWLHPTADFVIWATATGTAGVPAKDNGTSTVTTTAATFYDTMVGFNLVFGTSGNSYPIASYTSSTVVVVTGDASGEADAQTVTVTATGNYQLPDDFGILEDNITYDASGRGERLPIVPDTEILTRRSNTDMISFPTHGAIRPKSSDLTAGQRWELLTWPITDADYTLQLPYSVLVNALSSTNLYPLGGMMQSSLVLQSCLAVMDDWHWGGQRGHRQRFLDALVSAIDRDNQGLPDTLGVVHNPRTAHVNDPDLNDFYRGYVAVDLTGV